MIEEGVAEATIFRDEGFYYAVVETSKITRIIPLGPTLDVEALPMLLVAAANDE
jgi:hypothetical protein